MVIKYNYNGDVLILCLQGPVFVTAYGFYRDNIPNGHIVPHPCRDDNFWEGVGHKTSPGGSHRNPFGLDFIDAGKSWTKALCEKDSDGDGKTNGMELGDPQCTWVYSEEPQTKINISHPGICEPWTDIKCKDQLDWLIGQCEEPEFNCDAIKRPEVKNITLQFPFTTVPSQETTYMCMEFNLDNSDDFHLIATQPILNNTNIMHHAVLFGCSSDAHGIRDVPHQCGMVASGECQQILSIWTLGSPGECFHDKVGFRIGTNGIKRVALQFHWNNPGYRDDYKDQSGMILHYTNSRRENDAGVLTIGADVLEIPPQTSSVEQTSVCPGTCTSKFLTGSIFVVSAFNHMHYLGRSQKIEVFRNGQKLLDLTNDEKYAYDSPKVHDKPTPIELKPGDTLSTTCVFNSEDQSSITYFGDATSSEMCFGFITYYPRTNNKELFCTAWKSLPNCELYGTYTEDKKYKGCAVNRFKDLIDDEHFMFSTLRSFCNELCSTACNDELNKLFLHPCMSENNLRDFFNSAWQWYSFGRDVQTWIGRCFPGGFPTLPTEIPSTSGFTTLQSTNDSNGNNGPTSPKPTGSDGNNNGPTSPKSTGSDGNNNEPTSPKPTGDGNNDGPSSPKPTGGDGNNNGPSSPKPTGGDGSNNGPSSPKPTGSDSNNNGPLSPKPTGGDGNNNGPSSPKPTGSDGNNDGPTSPKPTGSDGNNDGPTPPKPTGSDGNNDGPTSPKPTGDGNNDGPTSPKPTGGDGNNNGPASPKPTGGDGNNDGPTSPKPTGSDGNNDGPTSPKPTGSDGNNGTEVTTLSAYNGGQNKLQSLASIVISIILIFCITM